MNIKFGMDNFHTRYLKRFLNHECGNTNSILGKFDKDDLQSLINYLNLPNVKTMFEVAKDIVIQFPELNQYFNITYGNDMITWYSRVAYSSVSEFLKSNLDKFKDYCATVGWELAGINDWLDLSKDINSDGNIDVLDRDILINIVNYGMEYDETIMKKADLNVDGFVNQEDIDIFDNYLNTNRMYISIKKSNRKNYFPNKDMLVFINQFDGTFLYNYEIKDRNGQTIDGIPHPDPMADPNIDESTLRETHKIALYKCKPRTKNYYSTQ